MNVEVGVIAVKLYKLKRILRNPTPRWRMSAAPVHYKLPSIHIFSPSVSLPFLRSISSTTFILIGFIARHSFHAILSLFLELFSISSEFSQIERPLFAKRTGVTRSKSQQFLLKILILPRTTSSIFIKIINRQYAVHTKSKSSGNGR